MKIGNWKVAKEAIEKYDSIVIFHHIRPDGDCLGCQAGLAQLIKDNYPNKKVYKVGDNGEVLTFMNYDFDEISTIDFNNSLGIVCDASSSDRIQESHLLLDKKFTATLRIDHHPNGSDIEYNYLWVDEHYVAAAEMIAELAKESNWKISEKAAKHVFLGIVTDSGRFLYADTSSRTFKLVANLLDEGKFNQQDIHRELNKRTMQDLKFTGHILSNFKKEGRVLYYFITKEVMDEFKFSTQKAAMFVNELANIDDNSCWALFIEQEDGTVRGRLRSNGPLVNKVANLHGGGGHDNAAGVTIDSANMISQIINELNDAIKEWEEK